MEITYQTGDLFQGPERILIHGCNARATYASGFAGLVRRLYPQARHTYLDHHSKHGLTMGEVIWADCGDRIIGNAITQKNYGRDPKIVYADYGAIRLAIRATNEFIQELQKTSSEPIDRVAMPTIGCGLANGSWKIVSQIITEESKNFVPVVYLLDGIVPHT